MLAEEVTEINKKNSS